ncbi:MAG: class I SAM-dependent methyltransferase [Bacteroidota bacterium]|nr:class I SAM-dependent methyltransferase [Bacteroidota bacterium]
MKKVHSAYEYFKHRIFSKSMKSLDSIDVNPKIKAAFQDDRTTYALSAYFEIMDELLANKEKIQVEDKGAGSSKMGAVRRISKIAKYAVLNEFDAAFLSSLLYFLAPKNVLELGTSLGVSSLCMGLSAPKSEIHSVDACPQTHSEAANTLKTYAVDNVELHTMSFMDFLTSNQKKWDFVLLDGDHRYKQTLELLEIIKPQLTDDAVILIDDIHWSPGMTKAWQKIINSKEFLSIDLYYFGLLMPGTGRYRLRFF